MKKVNVVQPTDGKEMPLDILATHIEEIANFARSIDASRLKRQTICLLVRDYTKIGMRDISAVLDALGALEEMYLKPKGKKLTT